MAPGAEKIFMVGAIFDAPQTVTTRSDVSPTTGLISTLLCTDGNFADMQVATRPGVRQGEL